MLSVLRTSAVLLASFTLLTGIVYPFAVVGVSQVAFPKQANGSIITRNGKDVGSALIGQPFDSPNYFWSRPSATGPTPYNASASTGSNLGPSNPALIEAVGKRVQVLMASSSQRLVPVDLVTASASGLDPHISPASAIFQIERVAKARNFPPAVLEGLVKRVTTDRVLGVIGEPVVNVVELNLLLDEVASKGN